jgi:signal transduction histidine kinase
MIKLSLKGFFALLVGIYVTLFAFVVYNSFEMYKKIKIEEVAKTIKVLTLQSSDLLQMTSENGDKDKYISNFFDLELLDSNTISSISIVSSDNIVKLSTDRNSIGNTINFSTVDNVDSFVHGDISANEVVQSVEYFSNGVKIKDYLVVKISSNFMSKMIAHIMYEELFVKLAVIGLVLIFLLMFMWLIIAKPMARLLQVAKDPENNNLDWNFYFRLSEIDTLRESIINSFGKLKTYTDDLNELNEQLEKRVSDELVKSRQKDYILIQQSKLATMGEMINAIAHQWRQPLNSLGLSIQDIKYAYEQDEITKEYINTIIKESMEQIKYMSKTIDDFRNFYKPNKEKKLFGINSALKGSMSLVKARLEAHFFKITELYDNDMPEINGYENEFKQAILNIISNTQDAAEERKISSPTVSIKSGFRDGYALVEIEDNCGGIPESIINRIFEPYFTTKDQGKGTGIGLFMSKTIIEENMNGILEVFNIPNGVRFTIKLPVI